MVEAAYLLEKAEQLSRLAKHVRQGGVGLHDLADELDGLASELTLKAVEIQDVLDQSSKPRIANSN